MAVAYSNQSTSSRSSSLHQQAVFPFIERWFLHGGERENILLLQSLSDRLITNSDLSQFLEAILAAVCDQFQVSTGFLAAIGDSGLD